MAQADNHHSRLTVSVPLSALFSDALVADAFRRAERDNSGDFAIVPVRPITLAGGAAEQMEVEYA
jgi:hypothetical protein